MERVLADMIAAELGRMRPGRSARSLSWNADLPLGQGGFEADSLERLRLAEALAQAFGIEGPDDLLEASTLCEVAVEMRRLLPDESGAITFLT